ncbi:hypothetical protein SHIRM173S_11753 [Streptomyces hirsutus]
MSSDGWNSKSCTAVLAVTGTSRPGPDLHEVLERYCRGGMTYVILDGTLIESDWGAAVREKSSDWWFSQKHKAFGGNAYSG